MLTHRLSLKKLVLLSVLVAVCGVLDAAVKLPALFSNHMVLQRADKVPVWGWADAGEEVSVRLGEQHAKARAGKDGRWQVTLNLANATERPQQMVVRATNELIINDVLVGQVWLASGQSNMHWELKNTIGGKEELAKGGGSQIREFKVRQITATERREDVSGEWIVAEPGNMQNASAVAYFFAKGLNAELKQPVGIINSSWGGSPSEAWTSMEALTGDSVLAEAIKRRNEEVESFPRRKAEYAKALDVWATGNGVADAVFAPVSDFASENVDVSLWNRIRVSNEIRGSDLPRNGVIWIRRDVNIPAAAAGNDLTYLLDEGRGFYTFYWNGQRVAGPETWGSTDFGQHRGIGVRYSVKIPANMVKAGRNVLAIRIYAPAQTPASGGGRNQVYGAGGFTAVLGGSNEWRAKAEKFFTLSAAVLEGAPQMQTSPQHENRQPARLFNAMISPLISYSIAGVIWYQGESNAGRAYQYRRAFTLLINDWRAQWGEPDLQFYFCQLAGYRAKRPQPTESDWAELREAQSEALRLAYTGQAVLIDIGEAEDIHPRNKQEAGHRLARLALAGNYGRTAVQSQSPRYESHRIEGSKVYVTFTGNGAGSDLVAQMLPETYVLKSVNNTSAPLHADSPDSQLQGFAVCGEDGKWVWARAEITSPYVVAVWSPQVANPVAVRYAWADNPTCNLYNSAGLPAAPFRTDDFRPITFSGTY